MFSPKYVIVESDPNLIKCNGDNGGYIYNPTGLFYHGETFHVLPGEPLMIVPYQPFQLGPWKLCRTAFVDGRFLKCKNEETFTIMIENRFPNRVFKVTNGCSLAGILNRWGISHEMTFTSDHQLEKIESAHEIIALDETTDDEKF